jgi:hypothetical protein
MICVIVLSVYRCISKAILLLSCYYVYTVPITTLFMKPKYIGCSNRPEYIVYSPRGRTSSRTDFRSGPLAANGGSPQRNQVISQLQISHRNSHSYTG